MRIGFWIMFPLMTAATIVAALVSPLALFLSGLTLWVLFLLGNTQKCSECRRLYPSESLYYEYGGLCINCNVGATLSGKYDRCPD